MLGEHQSRICTIKYFLILNCLQFLYNPKKIIKMLINIPNQLTDEEEQLLKKIAKMTKKVIHSKNY
jgi:hypothetical protein